MVTCDCGSIGPCSTHNWKHYRLPTLRFHDSKVTKRVRDLQSPNKSLSLWEELVLRFCHCTDFGSLSECSHFLHRVSLVLIAGWQWQLQQGRVCANAVCVFTEWEVLPVTRHYLTQMPLSRWRACRLICWCLLCVEEEREVDKTRLAACLNIYSMD